MTFVPVAEAPPGQSPPLTLPDPIKVSFGQKFDRFILAWEWPSTKRLAGWIGWQDGRCVLPSHDPRSVASVWARLFTHLKHMGRIVRGFCFLPGNIAHGYATLEDVHGYATFGRCSLTCLGLSL